MQVSKSVPRIGDEITFYIDNFGYENKNETIGHDYGILFYNNEEVDKYNSTFLNNDALLLQKITLPSIKVETYEKESDKWINNGTELNLLLHLRNQTTFLGSHITAPNESKEHTIYREDILNHIQENNSYLGSLKESKLCIESLDENGNVFEQGKHHSYNRITSDGPLKSM